MKFKNNTKLGKISFCIAMFIVFYIIGTIILDFAYPINFDGTYSVTADNIRSIYALLDQYKVVATVCILFLALVDFVLGIITLFQKASNKKLSVITLIISSPFALVCIVGNVQGLMIRFSM